jgi:hypothetical protein
MRIKLMKSLSPAALDGSAVGLSALCLAHCLLLPLGAAVLPLLGAWAEAEWVHPLFVGLAAPIAGLTFLRPSEGAPRPPAMIVLAALGLILLLIALASPHDWEALVTAAGGVCLAGAHLWNWRRRHRLRPCDET